MATPQVLIVNDVYVNGKMADWAISAEFSKETEKAVLARVFYTQAGSACVNREVWIPKSVLVVDAEKKAAHLPLWFVNKNFEPMAR